MRNLFKIAVITLLSIACLGINTAEASSRGGAKQTNQNKAVISKAQAIAAVKRQMKGKVLSANLIKNQKPLVYRVKVLLAKGRVRTVFVDANNGQVLRVR